MTLTELIESVDQENPKRSAAELAAEVQERASDAQILEAIHWAVSNWRRNRVRSVEHQVNGQPLPEAPPEASPTTSRPEPSMDASAEPPAEPPKVDSDPARSDPLGGWRELLTKGVSVPKKGYLTWGQMTVADHVARIRMLASQRRGIDVTIRLHEDAIEAITEAGVSCLDDLYGAVA